MHRRRFLQLIAAGGTYSMLRPVAAWADDAPEWAALPTSSWPGTPPNFKVLEIFLYGGLSPWETFYFREGVTRGFETAIASLTWNCSAAPAGLETRDFANDTDATPKPVKLGPFTKPLWSDHIRRRMRVIVLSLLPHEAAVPYGLTGLRLGRPQFAGTGTPVARRARAAGIGGASRVLPYAYVCSPAVTTANPDNIAGSSATGLHPGQHRPLTLRIGSSDLFRTQLPRTNVGAGNDPLLRQYRSLYRDELRFRGTATPPIRSKAFNEYNASLEALLNAPQLDTLLAGAPLLRTDRPCVGPSTVSAINNIPGTGLRLAAYLLTRPAAEAARYVCVVDSGLEEASGGGGYDTHSGHVRSIATNLMNTLITLTDIIRDPANPRAGDDARISLDDTLIVLNTEFGRTPYPSTNGSASPTATGRDHYTYGYTVAMIGGPITDGLHAVRGAIDDTTDGPTVSYTPTDVKAAVLMAAGIDPFPMDGSIFGATDISSAVSGGAGDFETIRNGIRTHMFGI